MSEEAANSPISAAPACEDDVCALPGAVAADQGRAPITPDIVLPARPAPRSLPQHGDEPSASPLSVATAVREEPDSVTFTDYAESRGWGDGLPLVPPTAARVDAFLAALPSQIDPDEIIAALPPRGGLVTRRLLAVNAVMAGCRPELLPVLTTAVRALTRSEINLRGVNATTHPVAPLVIVHGDAVNALGFNAGLGTFGPGSRANATLGRALRLVLLNVAGARPGEGDASTQGQPSKFSYCIAENTPESPFESYLASCHLTSASAVTVACGENPHNVQDHECRSAELTLDMIASVMTTLGSNNAPVSSAEFFLCLGPEHAAHLNDAGYGRREIQQALFERARRPAGEFRRAFNIAQYADWEDDLADSAPKPIMRDPELIRVLVTGGAGKHSCVIPSWGMTKSVTLPLEA